MRPVAILLFVLLCGIGAPLMAQDAPSPDAAAEGGDAVVVSGQRDRRAAIGAFVRAVTVETDDQIARFDAPACPLGIGLPPSYDRVIESRLRAIADRIGLGTGNRHCRPNIVIVATRAGADLVAQLRRHRPELFGSLDPVDLRRIDRQPGPVRAWQSIEPRSRDGRPLEVSSYLQIDGGAQIYIGRHRTNPTTSLSLTSTPTRQAIALVFVVIDSAALEGLTLRQIADHAAMRAFARTRSTESTGGRSILGLFADRQAGLPLANELTDWDMAYLTGLYRTAGDVKAALQKSAIGTFMRQTLDKEASRPTP